MAVIETNTKSSLHLRSNSLPSTPHPLVSQFEDNLQRLKSSEGTSSASSSLPYYKSAVKNGLMSLLEGSLRILDICSIAKDFLLLSIESNHEIQSIIRRRRANETGLTCAKYMAFRKNVKKQIRKVLVNLRSMKNDLISSSSNKKENNSSPMLQFLKEAEAVTLSSLEHLFLFISDPKGHSKNGRWSAISKLMHSKRVVCDSQESDTNEFEKVDAASKSLISNKLSCTENVQSHLEDLEICIQDLEIGVERISRKLIKNRVSLLNIFNH
ncbi:unnamed protein product [Vicia faba]|uniref:DUF241 domain protein n=1 Tax=Vicia faba TaxID=3906 RepID=A0AAV1B312_VICFA|nr:unnamed protein product [Vicia faba]